MFKIFKPIRETKKKLFSVHFKVFADSKPIAEFFVKAPGHNRKQAMDLANRKVKAEAVKAFLIKEEK